MNIFLPAFLSVLLATGEPSADFIYKLIAGLSLLANFGLLMSKIRGGGEKRQITNTPLEVAQAAQHVNRSDYEAHLARNREAHERLSLRLEEQKRENEAKLENIWEAISATSQNVSEMRGEMKHITKAVETIATAAAEASRLATAANVEAQHKR